MLRTPKTWREEAQDSLELAAHLTSRALFELKNQSEEEALRRILDAQEALTATLRSVLLGQC